MSNLAVQNWLPHFPKLPLNFWASHCLFNGINKIKENICKPKPFHQLMNTWKGFGLLKFRKLGISFVARSFHHYIQWHHCSQCLQHQEKEHLSHKKRKRKSFGNRPSKKFRHRPSIQHTHSSLLLTD